MMESRFTLKFPSEISSSNELTSSLIDSFSSTIMELSVLGYQAIFAVTAKFFDAMQNHANKNYSNELCSVVVCNLEMAFSGTISLIF
jgi:benzoyl-CoA reductase/2-hydroxyglutaryl-CoA dehydratase subunit BcrC/BadD/HgdB